MEIALVLGLLVVAIILFATEKLSVDIITLILLIILVLSGILVPKEAFEGFSSDFIIILASIFVISGALRETGMLDRIGANLTTITQVKPAALTLVIMGITGSISAFMNNTTVTALLVGPVMGICRKLNISASKILIPMAFASILGGTCTLIGTSTNVAVSGYLIQAKLAPVGMFEILPMGLIMFGTGVLYIWAVGRRFLPDHKDYSLTENYAIREYLSEVVVVKNSPLIGQKIVTSNLSGLDIRILKLIRNKTQYFPHPYLVIEEGDMLLVETKIDQLLKIRETSGIEIKADTLKDITIETADIQLAEVLITNSESELVGLTIKSAGFRQRYGLVVLAIYRHGQTLRDKISSIELHLGDLLLVQGTSNRIQAIRERHDLAIMGEEFTPIKYKEKRGLFTVITFMLAVIIGSLELAPLSICFLMAAVLTVLSKAIPLEKAYTAIDWRLLILIGGMSAFGKAMEKTGASNFLAMHIVDLLSPFGTISILAGFILLTVFLTQPMSNAAAALVVLPIALQTAQQLGANPRSFGIAIMLAASVSLVTPFEPSCILVYGPGKYKFMDFFKTGSVLTLLLIALLVIFVPIFWPF
ncbi:SLC13 family permease [Rhodocytophaga rosea]|uniref:SLC13 family permease n=1 Tax=Rhodocytophaga rosea TaxID=2704465 RepID=A0A6C0GMP8_9BACT|nr:SLC13 family permease [Rhodocytophaga rosea]QHT69114.1 SLC13 family permease [Rhodocytophaga rosea]